MGWTKLSQSMDMTKKIAQERMKQSLKVTMMMKRKKKRQKVMMKNQQMTKNPKVKKERMKITAKRERKERKTAQRKVERRTRKNQVNFLKLNLLEMISCNTQLFSIASFILNISQSYYDLFSEVNLLNNLIWSTIITTF